MADSPRLGTTVNLAIKPASVGTQMAVVSDWGGSPVKLSNPGSLPTGTAREVAWSPDGRFLAVAHVTSPYITVYETGLSARRSVLPYAYITTAEWLEGD